MFKGGMNLTQINPKEFKKAFEAAFMIHKRSIWWDTDKRRTSYMESHIYRTIGAYLDLEVEYEYKNIDAVFYDKGNKKGYYREIDEKDILIAVEHENDVKTIKEELKGFTNNNYGLNVLITYTGNREEYIDRRHRDIIETIKGEILIIIHSIPQKDFEFGKDISWKYYSFKKDEGKFDLLA